MEPTQGCEKHQKRVCMRPVKSCTGDGSPPEDEIDFSETRKVLGSPYISLTVTVTGEVESASNLANYCRDSKCQNGVRQPIWPAIWPKSLSSKCQTITRTTTTRKKNKNKSNNNNKSDNNNNSNSDSNNNNNNSALSSCAHFAENSWSGRPERKKSVRMKLLFFLRSCRGRGQPE